MGQSYRRLSQFLVVSREGNFLVVVQALCPLLQLGSIPVLVQVIQFRLRIWELPQICYLSFQDKAKLVVSMWPENGSVRTGSLVDRSSHTAPLYEGKRQQKFRFSDLRTRRLSDIASRQF